MDGVCAQSGHQGLPAVLAFVDRVFESDMPNSVNLSALLCFPIVRSHVVGQRARSAFELAQKLQNAAGHRLP